MIDILSAEMSFNQSGYYDLRISWSSVYLVDLYTPIVGSLRAASA